MMKDAFDLVFHIASLRPNNWCVVTLHCKLRMDADNGAIQSYRTASHSLCSERRNRRTEIEFNNQRTPIFM